MSDAQRAGVLRTVRELPRGVAVLVFGIAVNRMGNFVQIFLMLYLTRDGGYSAAQSGTALTAYGAGAIAGVFVGGSAIDRIGARRAIVVSMAASGLFVAAIPAVAGRPLWLLLVVACGAGATGQLYRPAATALLADLTPTDQLLMASAAMRLGLNTGAAVGPLLGSLLARQSYTLVFLTNAATSLAFAAVILWLLPRDVGRGKTVTARTGAAAEAGELSPTGTGYLPVLRDRRYLLVVSGTFLVAVAEVQYQTVLPLVVTDRGHSDFVYTALVALNAVLVIVTELPLTRRLERVPVRVTMSVGSALIGVGIAMFGLPAGLWILVVGTLVWTFGEVVSAPPVSAYPALTAPAHLRGRYIGLMTTSQSIGYALGPALGAALFEVRGGAVWIMCAGLGLGAGALLWTGAGRQKAGSARDTAAEGARATPEGDGTAAAGSS